LARRSACATAAWCRRNCRCKPSRASLKLLTQDGEPVGNLCYATVGNRSMFTIFTGVYFEQAGLRGVHRA
jgi:hypothetical protein